MAQSFTLTATGVTKIATAGLNAGPGGWYLVFTANTNGNGTAWNGSAVLAQDRTAPGSVSQPIAAASLTNVAYYNPSTGASVNAGTAITATGDWQVDATGYDLYVVLTLTTADTSVTVTVIPASQLVTEPQEGALPADTPIFSGVLSATRAQATPSALAATAFNAFASTVSGAVLMGYGTTGDATLKNRAGTTVAYVGPNTTKFWMIGAADVGGNFTVATNKFAVDSSTGAITAAGAVTGVTTLAMSGALSGLTTATASSDIMAGAAAYLGFTGRGAISSPSDGQLKLSNAAGTSFSDLYYGAEAGATTAHRIQKAIASIADNTDTAVFTVTVPNAAHSAMVRVTLLGSLGAGGAIGANEASQTISYDVGIARTAGVATVATASSAYGSGNSAVVGAATITVVGSVGAMTGAVGATQTFPIYVKVTKGSGASDNHTCVAIAEILNANATGVSIA